MDGDAGCTSVRSADLVMAGKLVRCLGDFAI